MKFEDNIEALAEGIVEALGPQASEHAKLQALEARRGVSRKERTEVMLEVVLEVLEKQGRAGAKEGDQTLEEIKGLRRDFSGLVGRLENLKIKVPKSMAGGRGEDSAELVREVAAIKKMLSELTALQHKSVTIKRLWWTVGMLAVVIVLLIVLCF